jgi:hypothetical protein
MSLWLQAVLENFACGDYEHLRVNLMPMAPIPIPQCMMRELAFGERCCRELEKDRLFPIRFIWLMEAHEQRMFDLDPTRSSYIHPEKLLDHWNRASSDAEYRKSLEASGCQFDFVEKAIKVEDMGWIYIGEQFIEDFLQVEAVLGFAICFPDPLVKEGKPAFQAERLHRREEQKTDPSCPAIPEWWDVDEFREFYKDQIKSAEKIKILGAEKKNLAKWRGQLWRKSDIPVIWTQAITKGVSGFINRDHWHASFSLGGHDLHIDYVSLLAGVFTISCREYRIFVNQNEATRGGGFTGKDGSHPNMRNFPLAHVVDDYLIYADNPLQSWKQLEIGKLDYPNALSVWKLEKN